MVTPIIENVMYIALEFACGYIYDCDMPYPELSFAEVTSAVGHQNVKREAVAQILLQTQQSIVGMLESVDTIKMKFQKKETEIAEYNMMKIMIMLFRRVL
ncbi:hypothetical protein HAX54_014907 [Datura stramonium]|uniref:Uncharacterized protein n=1 Tax=Datura stramonium TaxID=4076 RepID=A0ABS8RZ40_DATST|nr:hypothetical protein [Datura stramonium]